MGLRNSEEMRRERRADEKKDQRLWKEHYLTVQTIAEESGGRLIGDQIFRSGTSVAANYRAACRARSRAEFISKLSIVEEEADETLFWLEVIKEMEIISSPLLDYLMKESNEIIAIVVSSIKTSRRSK